ncbi:MAG: polysaccharide pyruvyl transferase family protein [Actinomycetota bacterium]|nr:polysaccharide pyruvyl transferase family protein [Actinomycetota bacterium]
MPTVTLVSFAGRGGAGDDLALHGTVQALRELSPDASLTAVVAAPDGVRAFLDPAVRLVEGPLRTLGATGAATSGALRGRRTAHAAERMLDAALAGGDAPAPIREAVEAAGSSDLVLLLGSGYLSDRRPLELLAAGMLAEAARRRGVRYALFGHSVGPFERGGPLPRARRLLEGAERIAIREPRSSWEVGALLRGRSADLLGDPAFLLPRAGPAAEWPARILANFRGVTRLVEYRKAPDEPGLTLADGVYMVARQLRADVSYVEAGTPPAWDDRAGNEVIDRGVLPAVERGPRFAPTAGGPALPPAAVAVSTVPELCAWALANGLPAVGVALTPHDRHELRGLMELFQRPDWVWVPEAEFGIFDLSGRAVQAANDPNRAELHEIADGLAVKQRAWLASLVSS